MAILHVISVMNMVACYRKHMLRFYRGDFQFLSKFEPGPYIALTDALKYASYQVIFTIAGWCFGTVMLVMVFGFVSMVLILPYFSNIDVGTGAFWPWVWNTFLLNSEESKMGILTLCLLLYLFLMGMVWFVFLDKKVRMAIRNRELWDVFDLFQTVTNFIVGFFVFIRRLLTLIIFGFLFISRLDKPLVPRGYEWIDPGFATYQGFLYVEMYYSNPVMLTFIQLLIEEHCDKEVQEDEQEDDDALLQVEQNVGTPRTNQRGTAIAMKKKKLSKARKMWSLAYTLIKNPQLRELRAHRGTWCAKKVRYSLRPRGGSLASDQQSEFYSAIESRIAADKNENAALLSNGNAPMPRSPLRQVESRRRPTSEQLCATNDILVNDENGIAMPPIPSRVQSSIN